MPKAEPMAPGPVSFIEAPTSNTHLPYVPPFAHGAPKDCDPQFSNDPAAKMIRVGDDGGYEHYVPGQGWQPVAPGAACPTGGTAPQSQGVETSATGAPVLLVLPQTSLSTAASAGDRVLEIVNPLDYAPELFPGGLPAWFAAGQRVIVNPGGANEEIATVESVGSLHLAGALSFDHEAGEMVSVLPAEVPAEPEEPPPPSSPPAAVGGIETVSPPTASAGELAFTGAQPSLFVLGIVMLLVGLFLVLVTRAPGRRRTTI